MIYRCYFLDAGGHIAAVEVIESEDDDSACRRCHDLHAGRAERHGVELWHQDRLIHAHRPSGGMLAAAERPT